MYQILTAQLVSLINNGGKQAINALVSGNIVLGIERRSNGNIRIKKKHNSNDR